MVCVPGAELLNRYKAAVQDRETVRDILLTSSARHFRVDDLPFEDLMLVARLRYSDAFVAWVRHRGACTACDATYGRNDRLQFASV